MTAMVYQLKERGTKETGWNGNEAGATNDSHEVEDHLLPSSGVVDGFPVEYTCEPSTARPLFPLRRPDPLVKNTTVSFDYEVLVNDEDVTDAMSDFETTVLPGNEWGLLWTMAESAGILNPSGSDCMLDALPPSLGTRNLRGHRRTQDEPEELDRTFVVGLNRMPRDTVDEAATCQQIQPEAGTKCFPVSGTMEAQYIGDDEEGVKKYVLDLAQAELDGQQSLVAPAQQTVFLPAETTNRNALVSNKRETNTVIATAAAGASGLALLLGILLFSRRSKKTEDEAVVVNESDLSDDDIAPSRKRLTPSTRSSSPSTPVRHPASAKTLRSDDDISTEETTRLQAPQPANDDSPDALSRTLSGDVDKPSFPSPMPIDLKTAASDDSEVSSNSNDERDGGPAVIVSPSPISNRRSPIIVETVSETDSSDEEDSTNNPVVVINPFDSPKNMPDPVTSPSSLDESAASRSDDDNCERHSSPSPHSDDGSDVAVRVVQDTGDHMIDSLGDDEPIMSSTAVDLDDEVDVPVQTVGESGHIVDFLPPLPPGHTPSPSRAQAQLKKRRKKKKLKKKKNALTRINSRESINEMESIPEEDNSYQDGVGSECSWTSDEESSGRASRDPSPAPSVSSAGSSGRGKPTI